jgi:phosphoglycolate phosphatase
MKTLFFDLDGTLIDSALGITRCVAHALEKMHVSVPPESALRAWIGPPLRESFAPFFNGDLEKTEAAVLHYRERFETHGWAEHTLYPDIENTLQQLVKQGHRLAVVTAKNEPHAVKIIENYVFAKHFDTVSGSTLDGRISHKAQLIEQALQRLNLAAADCVMIGDRYMDMEGAQHHDMQSVAVTWGFGSHAELTQANPSFVIHSPSQLVTLFSSS